MDKAIKAVTKFDSKIGFMSYILPISSRPIPPSAYGNWLIYKIPDWIQDDMVKNCISCKISFTIWNRRVC